MMRTCLTLLALALTACLSAPALAQSSSSEAGGGTVNVVLELPTTTTSTSAQAAFSEGLYALDMQRPLDARMAFERATELDPDFALAHFYLANTATSLSEYLTSLAAAEKAASNASRAEQLMIESSRLSFDRDFEGAANRLKELTTIKSNSPRAWLALANAQVNLNQHEEARASIRRAIDLHPDMAAAHLTAGTSYLFGEPRDLDRAERHMQKAVDLAPGEPMPYDYLGDVYRAKGDLEAARDAYTRAAEFSPNDGSPYQQRAHVNTFLGDYDAARADYDRSIEMARANQVPSYGVYRALVSVHADEYADGIAELEQLADDIDEMDIPEPTGLKIFALGTALDVALHHGMTDKAGEILDEWTTLMRTQAESVGTAEFRRGQEAQIAAAQARLALARGEADAAMEHVTTMKKLLADDPNPRKMEPVHAVIGEHALMKGDHEKAIEHLMQADVANDIRVKFLLAQAKDGAGHTDEARELYKEIATWYFNDPQIALTRRTAAAKLGM